MKNVTAINYLLLFALLSLAENLFASEELTLRYQGIAHDAFYDTCFRGKTGLMVGAFGTMVSSNDYGKQWQKVKPFTSLSLFGVTCNRQHNIVVGQQGRIYRQEAEQWVAVNSGTTERLLSVSMNSKGLAIAVGGFGTVLRSQDFGRRWETLSFNWEAIVGDFVEPHMYDVRVFDDGSIMLVGEFGLILRSTDLGNNWQKLRQGDSSLFALTFSGGDLGFAVGQNGTIVKTTDAGESWKKVNSAVTANLLGVDIAK